jgi:hypothetical protein
MSDVPAPRLTLDDILDLRAYERIRPGYRRRVMERKRVRRIALGPLMTVVFESVDTVRFQVHEMARVEKIVTDEGIQAELDVYNQLLPGPGELSATLFIELTSEAQLREWLPKLVGIESALGIELRGGGDGATDSVPSVPEAGHLEALTRETVTPAVHYLRFVFTPDQVRAFAGAEADLVAEHPAYQARTTLEPVTRAALLGDLQGRTEPLPYEGE